MATGFHVDLLPTRLREYGKDGMDAISQNFYFRIIERFNRMEKYEPIKVNKAGLLSLLGYDIEKGYNSEQIKDIIKSFTKPVHFQHKSINVSGTVFNVMWDEKIEEYIIYFNDPFKGLIFTEYDFLCLDKAKKKKRMEVKELDYWDRELKYKKEKLRLLSEADFMGLDGKYSKLIYALIKKFDGSKVIYLTFEQFKSEIGIPDSYKMNDLDKRVIKPALEELKELGYNLVFEKKKTKGKGNKTTHIDIKYTVDVVKQKKRENGQDKIKSVVKIRESEKHETESEIIENPDGSVEMRIKSSFVFDKPVHKEIPVSENKLEELTEEQENEAIKLIKEQGISELFLQNMKKKSPSIYINTLKEELKNKR